MFVICALQLNRNVTTNYYYYTHLTVSFPGQLE